MRRRACALLLAGFVWAGAAARQRPAQRAGAGKAEIAGTVVDASTQQPLRKAWVTLRPLGGPRPAGMTNGGVISTITDSGGHFEIRQIDAGVYLAEAGRNGYVTETYGAKAGKNRGTRLRLRPGTKMTGLRFRLIPAGVISGHVTDEDGEPMPWVIVEALRIQYSYEGSKGMLPVARASTDDLGAYRVFGLAPGRYYVEASYRPGMQVLGAISFMSQNVPQAGNFAYPPQVFFPGSTNPADASRVSVTAGEETAGIDFSLRPSRAYRVSGQVTGASAAAAGPTTIIIRLVPKGEDFAGILPPFQAVVRNGGRFEIRGVVPGSYVLMAVQFSQGTSFVARLPVVVGEADVTGLNVTIQAGSDVAGQLTVDGRTAAAPARYTVFLRPTERLPFGGGSNAAVLEDGTFTLKNVAPGSYRVGVAGLAASAYVKSVRLGTHDALEKPLEIDSGGTSDRLAVAVDTHGAQVSGTVRGAGHLPAAGATVALVPEPALRQVHSLYNTITTDQDGSFTIFGIRPGNYKLFAWEEVESGAWFDPDFLKPYEDKGTEIELGEGERKTVELDEIPATGSSQAPKR